MKKNISKNLPLTSNVFIDSNVLVYAHAFIAEKPIEKKKQHVYSKALGYLLSSSKISLFTTWLNIAELFNVLERKVLDDYRIEIKDNTFKLKDFRKIPEQRERVYKEIMRVYNEVSIYYTIKNVEYKEKTIDAYATGYLKHIYDSADYVMASLAEDENISEIITDDSDFFNDSRFTVYTYHDSVSI